MSRSVFSLLLASVSILPSPGTAQIPGQGEHLRGLTGISISVLGVTERAERDGVDTARVRTVVELVLRSAGIRLFTFEESQELDTSVRNAVLRCQASILYNASGTIATFVVKVDLEEGLLTVGQQVVFGRIWTSGAFGSVGKDNLRETIIDDFKVHAEKFANDYLAANPRNR